MFVNYCCLKIGTLKTTLTKPLWPLTMTFVISVFVGQESGHGWAWLGWVLWLRASHEAAVQTAWAVISSEDLTMKDLFLSSCSCWQHSV